MDLVQLAHFVEVAKRENLTKAAQNLHISQPALSRLVSNLEEETGVKLFDRIGRHLYLNSFGEVVLKYSKKILADADNMKSEISDMQHGETGSLRIGSSFSSDNVDWMEEIIRWFVYNYPNVSFKIYAMNPTELQKTLISREIEIAFSSSVIKTQDNSNINWVQLFSETMGVLLSTNHELAKKPTLTLKDLENERFLINNTNSEVKRLTHDLCTKSNFLPNIFWEMDRPELIREMLIRGMGIALMSREDYMYEVSKMRDWVRNEVLTFRPLTDEHAVRTFSLGTLSGRYQPKFVKDLYNRILLRFSKSNEHQLYSPMV